MPAKLLRPLEEWIILIANKFYLGLFIQSNSPTGSGPTRSIKVAVPALAETRLNVYLLPRIYFKPSLTTGSCWSSVSCLMNTTAWSIS